MVGFIKYGTAVVLLVGLAAGLSQDIQESIGTQWRRAIGDPGQVCFDDESSRMKDPFSARLDSYIEESPGSVRVTYRAKNSYGAYEIGKVRCVVTGRSVSPLATKLARELDQLRLDREAATDRLEKLRRENACLLERNREIVAGRETLRDCKLVR